jgi:hypothetical protein
MTMAGWIDVNSLSCCDELSICGVSVSMNCSICGVFVARSQEYDPGYKSGALVTVANLVGRKTVMSGSCLNPSLCEWD